MKPENSFALVAVLAPIKQPLVYSVANDLRDRLVKGSRVLVPLKRRIVTGVVLDVFAEHALTEVKAIIEAEGRACVARAALASGAHIPPMPGTPSGAQRRFPAPPPAPGKGSAPGGCATARASWMQSGSKPRASSAGWAAATARNWMSISPASASWSSA